MKQGGDWTSELSAKRRLASISVDDAAKKLNEAVGLSDGLSRETGNGTAQPIVRMPDGARIP